MSTCNPTEKIKKLSKGEHIPHKKVLCTNTNSTAKALKVQKRNVTNTIKQRSKLSDTPQCKIQNNTTVKNVPLQQLKTNIKQSQKKVLKPANGSIPETKKKSVVTTGNVRLLSKTFPKGSNVTKKLYKYPQLSINLNELSSPLAFRHIMPSNIRIKNSFVKLKK